MIIHHYTDSAGLLGIVESKTIRATNVWFMNDTVEATYGWERISKFLASKNPSSPKESEVLHILKTVLGGLSSSIDLDSYIACFSEKENDLSQWRAYGGGTGFSIGFDSDKLEQLAATASPSSTNRIRKVAYTDPEQETILQANYYQHITTQLSSASEAHTLAGAFMTMAILAMPSLKHPAFESENEWRLQFFFERSTGKVKFRSGAMGVTPYIEMPLCMPGHKTIEAIQEVRIGPQRHPDEARRAVTQFLARNGLSAVEVKPATVPLRPS